VSPHPQTMGATSPTPSTHRPKKGIAPKPRELLKIVARALATLLAAPWLLSFWFKAAVVGRDRALHGSSESLSMIPGLIGQYVRRAFLARVLRRCHPTASIGFGTLFSKAGASIGANVYIGPRCHIGLAIIEDDVLLAAGVHITSGAQTHGFGDLGLPVREQIAIPKEVRIGAGTWVGSAAVVMADVGCNTVVGAGAVVTKVLPDRVVAAGVPARVLRARPESASGAPPA
jgi:virginiamycin A acetyltransferase